MTPASSRIAIAPFSPGERAEWAGLWRQYLEFYDTELPPERYETTWGRLLAGRELGGLGARDGGRLVGIAHYLFHHHAWSDDVCYLQDLFVDPESRGRGVGRLLIEGVAAAADDRDAPRLYWMTSQTNARARRLYDRIAVTRHHIRYDYTWPRETLRKTE